MMLEAVLEGQGEDEESFMDASGRITNDRRLPNQAVGI